MEETISLKEIFQTIRKRLWLIVMITAVAVATVGVVSFFFLTPVYQSSTQILVNQKASDQPYLNQSDIRTNIDLINTYNEIIKTPAILDLVKKELNLTEPLGDLITVGSSNNSQVMKITVEHTDPQMAVDIANTTANVFKNEIVTIMNVDNVSILSPAVVPENPVPVKPNPMLNMAIALVVGLMAGVGLAFLLEYLDNTIKTEQDIEKLLELPVLGAIAQIDLEEETRKASESGKSRNKGRGDSLGA
ncbi:capsular biosynthesis protein [Bacillus timonensis]|uniref:Capsular biosynthesis protein n=1 Tax=Bacillus timonensis TaxID=1033734 RepID=A0A4V3V711_9BACI|nr:Wzz/FepE/Etk N-terminal domain-containing protein [Bacillus timonensis]THE09493.1 capsular biosynthesis protein [Bacillus timonensis]